MALQNIKNAPITDASGNLYFAAKNISLLSEEVVSLTSNGTLRWSFYPSSPEGVTAYVASPAFSTDEARVYAPLGETMYCLNSSSGAEI